MHITFCILIQIICIGICYCMILWMLSSFFFFVSKTMLILYSPFDLLYFCFPKPLILSRITIQKQGIQTMDSTVKQGCKPTKECHYCILFCLNSRHVSHFIMQLKVDMIKQINKNSNFKKIK